MGKHTKACMNTHSRHAGRSYLQRWSLSVRLRFIGEYARFDNIDNYNDDAAPMAIPSSMNANTSFDSNDSGRITIQSKMNSFDNEDTNFDKNFDVNDTPF